jgi:hypothetical protein
MSAKNSKLVEIFAGLGQWKYVHKNGQTVSTMNISLAHSIAVEISLYHLAAFGSSSHISLSKVLVKYFPDHPVGRGIIFLQAHVVWVVGKPVVRIRRVLHKLVSLDPDSRSVIRT